MSIYYIAGIYFLNLFLATLAIGMKPKIKAAILIIQAFLFSCLYGYRDMSIGTDTRNYVAVYNGHYKAEWGFTRFGEICHSIFGDGQNAYKCFLFVVCFWMALNFAYFYYVMCENNLRYVNIMYVAMFCMTYVISMSINVIRQGLAISLFVLGLALYKKEKKKRAYLVMLFAPLMHKSVLVVEVVYFLVGRIKDKKKRILLTTICSMICIVLSRTKIVYWILSRLHLNRVLAILVGYAIDNSSVGFSVKLIFYWGCVFVSSLVLYHLNVNQAYDMLNKLASAVLLITTLFAISEITASRFIINMDCILPLLLGLIYPKIKPQSVYIMLYIAMFGCILMITLKSDAFARQLGLV